MACCSNDSNEMKEMSPILYIENIAKKNLKIFHGKFDPVVPVSQSLELYEEIISKYPNTHVFLDVFDGSYEIDMETAFYLLISQYNGTKS